MNRKVSMLSKKHFSLYILVLGFIKLLLTAVLLIVSFAFISCGGNDQPFIETIDNQTIAVNASRTMEVYITDTDRNDMHTVEAFSENSRIATAYVKRRNIETEEPINISIEGKRKGRTVIVVSTTDDSGQDNDTAEMVFDVIVVEPEVIVSTPIPLKESNIDGSEISLSLIGLTFDRDTTNDYVNVSGIKGITAYTTPISPTEATVKLNYNYTDLETDSTLNIIVYSGAFEEQYRGAFFEDRLQVREDLRGHIEGPWLWMIAPGENIDIDNLSAASGGRITESQIAQSGVSEGEHFNSLQWTSGRLLSTTVCGIFLCSSDNVINAVRHIGLTSQSQLTNYSAYALINIRSPRNQNNVLMGVGSDDSVKVWLNGQVAYSNFTQRRTTGIQDKFHVNLNAGNNLLMVKVCNHGYAGLNDDWGMFFRIYISTDDYTLSLPR